MSKNEIVIKVSPQLSKAIESIEAGKRPVDAMKEMVANRKSARERDYAEGMRDEHY